MKRTVVTYVTVVALSVLTTLPAVCTPAHEETPRGFVLSLLRSYPHHGLKVGKIAAVESYAIVPFSGAWMEGKEWNSELLLKKYPFGWQALDYDLQPCKLRKRAIDARTTGALLRFIRHSPRSDPRVCDPRVCDGVPSDEGPVREVTTIRAQLRAKDRWATLYPLVRVADGFAVADWSLPGGGQVFFENKAGRWRVLMGGGGAASVNDLVQKGVPQNVARKLLRGIKPN